MANKTKKIIKNSWNKEFDTWYKKLQRQRKKELELSEKTGKPINQELSSRCWGHINYQFASHFFNLLKELKEKNADLYNKYVDKANGTMFFWDFNADVLQSEFMDDKCK